MNPLGTLSVSLAVFCLLVSALIFPFVFGLTDWTAEFKVAAPGESGNAYSVIQTSDGGYAISGGTYDMKGDSEVWLLKCDSSGRKLWNQSYGLGADYEYSVIQTSDGGYAIAGSAAYYTAGFTDFWLIKTDSSGNVQWNKKYGGGDVDRAYSIVQTEDGGYALGGTSNQDFWLLKVDSNGNEQWSRTYDDSQRDEAAFCIIRTSDAGYALAGKTSSENLKDFWLVKTDSNGNEQWSRTYGTSHEDIAYSVVQTDDGGYGLTGYSGTPNFYGDFLLVKTDSSGNMLWSEQYGGPYEDFGAYSIVQVNDGGYALAGGLNVNGNQRDFWIVRTDSSGQQLWNRTYGGSGDDIALSMTRTADGGYALAGPSADEQGVNQVLLIKAAVGDSIPEQSPTPTPTKQPAQSTTPSPSSSPSSLPSPTSSPSSPPAQSPEPTGYAEPFSLQEPFYVVAIAIGIIIIAALAIVTLKKQKKQ